MTGNARFFSLLLASVGVHAAVVASLGWQRPALPGGAGALQVTVSAEAPAASSTPRIERASSPEVTAAVTAPAAAAAAAAAPAATPVVTTHAVAPRRVSLVSALPAEATALEVAPSAASESLPAALAQPVAAVREASAAMMTPAAQSGMQPPPADPDLAAAQPRPSADQPRSELTDALGSTTPAAAVRGEDDLYAAAGRQLLAALQDHFAYPLRARRKGWEGDVLLGVDLDEAGVIAEVRLLASSGYAALDRAALASMRAVGALEQGWVGRLTVEVPVRYRLLN